MIDAGDIKNGRSAMRQGEVVARNIVRAIRGKCQIEYQQKWWEGLTKLTMGLVRIPLLKVLLIFANSILNLLGQKRCLHF